jgi:tetratricopeptide (TPR) repeat protein
LEEAREILLSGGQTLEREAMFHFNMGCYECQLGNLEEAKDWLRRAFSLDPKYRKVSREDPDLEPLRSWLVGKGPPVSPQS